jgi:hypothetical protein
LPQHVSRRWAERWGRPARLRRSAHQELGLPHPWISISHAAAGATNNVPMPAQDMVIPRARTRIRPRCQRCVRAPVRTPAPRQPPHQPVGRIARQHMANLGGQEEAEEQGSPPSSGIRGPIRSARVAGRPSQQEVRDRRSREEERRERPTGSMKHPEAEGGTPHRDHLEEPGGDGDPRREEASPLSVHDFGASGPVALW